MKNPIQAMFEAGVVERTDFPPRAATTASRSRASPAPTGWRSPISPAASRRRPKPSPPCGSGGWRQGDRLDRIAAAEIGDPEAFWMLCDANGAVWAEELETTGTLVRITLPPGVPRPEEET